MADWEMPEYWSSPSLSGLNLFGSRRACRYGEVDSLLDGKLARAAVFALCLVDASIGAAADEADDLVALIHPLLGVVPGEHGLGRVGRV